MALLPMATPSDRQESMFETEFESQTEPEFEGETDASFDDSEAFLISDSLSDPVMDIAPDPFEADKVISISAVIELVPTPEFSPESGTESSTEINLDEPTVESKHFDEAAGFATTISEPSPESTQHDPFADAARKSDRQPAPEPAPEMQSMSNIPSETESEPALSTLTSDDFAALEERVLRAVILVRHERKARAEAEQRSAELELQLAALDAQVPVIESLQQEVDSLRIEREQVRQRVERLLSQLDALEL